MAAGAKSAYLIEEPVAAALGAGIDISEPHGSMVVDIGGGTTDIAVLSFRRCRSAVNPSASEAINLTKLSCSYVRRYFNMVIGERTAEEAKKEIGTAMPGAHPDLATEIKGRDLMTGLPKVITITSEEINKAIIEQVEVSSPR